MRAIVHGLQRASTTRRIWPCCFGLRAIGNGRFIDGIFFGVRGLLRVRRLQATFVDGGGSHGFRKFGKYIQVPLKTRNREEMKATEYSVLIYSPPHTIHTCAIPVKGKQKNWLVGRSTKVRRRCDEGQL